MTDETLDFCPFCGGNAEVTSLFNSPPHGRTFVRCLSCFSSGPAARRDLAIQAWNTRPERDALREALAALERLCTSVAAPVGPQHAWWDDIFNARATLAHVTETPDR